MLFASSYKPSGVPLETPDRLLASIADTRLSVRSRGSNGEIRMPAERRYSEDFGASWVESRGYGMARTAHNKRLVRMALRPTEQPLR